jgi:hypothetical protein
MLPLLHQQQQQPQSQQQPPLFHSHSNSNNYNDANQKETAERDGSGSMLFVCVACIGLLFYVCALGFVCITCVLLSEYDTDECGQLLWPGLVAQVSVFGFTLLLGCLTLWDVESSCRACVSAPPLAPDDEGGLWTLLFGGSPLARWMGALFSFTLHVGFLVVLSIGISEATGEACHTALAHTSFTGTDALIPIAWVWLGCDALAALRSGARLLWVSSAPGSSSLSSVIV